ncbi:MAG TPA: FHA domain-containing protein [Aggregatilinea sp.]|uniref:FHA domain-containing protein n=1 Tax=Aggregatilinea sp. TaxID=2806333 RepID=UPI002C1409A8|nr:FHA domain-containing protein [Aggregatilinea sp.]HML24972.1 FHA domain-containing protein [Aggregatilinea sp.]
MPVPTDPLKEQQIRCSRCGNYAPPSTIRCPFCGEALLTLVTPVTVPVLRRSLTMQGDNNGYRFFPADARAILQLLPSGICLPIEIKKPIVLGRDDGGNADDILDLTEFNAVKHGVSRHHVMLRRDADRLLVSDLGSTNGTHLNGSLIMPQHEHVVAHGDKLILGTLHLLVSFSTFEADLG